MRLLILLVALSGLLLSSRVATAQLFSPTAGDILCWQPGQHLTVADFNPQHSEMMLRLHQEYGVQATATVAIFRVLDVPARKRDRGRLLEHAYFVPGWLRSRSETFTADTAELARQQLFLDLAELCCRRARQQMQALQDSLPRAYGTTYICYPRIASECSQTYTQLSEAYLREALLEKQPGAAEKWRCLVRIQLARLQAFATTTGDCERALTKRPVLPGYELSETLFSELAPCK